MSDERHEGEREFDLLDRVDLLIATLPPGDALRRELLDLRMEISQREEIFIEPRQTIEKLEEVIKKVTSPANRIGTYLASGGGKRIRPALLLLSARLLDYEEEEKDVRYATVVEFIHTATLVHDDVIDSAGTRRGRPTVNSAFQNSTTVMLGDYLFAHAADQVVGHRPQTVDVLREATDQVDLAAADVVQRQGAVEPGAVGVAEEVVARLHRGVHVGRIDRLGIRRPLARRASEVDWRGRYLSGRPGNRPWRDGDPTKGSTVLGVASRGPRRRGGG